MELVHTDDRFIDVIIKNWLRGSKDLGGGRKIRYYISLHEKGNTEPPLPQLDRYVSMETKADMSDVASDLDETDIFDDDDGTVARRNVSFSTRSANSPILQM